VLLICFYGALWLAASRLPPGQRRALARGIIIYLLIGSFSSEGIEKSNWLAVGLLFVWFWESRGQAFGVSGVRAFRRKSRTKTGSSLTLPDLNARTPEPLNATSGAT